MGRRVPEDVSVIGLGHFLEGSKAELGLTTVDIGTKAMSHLAVELLGKKMAGQTLASNLHLISPSLIEGTTVAECRD
jgi:DNA-binding LacI/PurR family transcriptional regulator